MPVFPLVSPPIQPNAIAVGNSRDPPEQPICLPYRFDFSAETAYQVDLSSVFQSGVISNIQTLYFDNSSNGADLIVDVQGSRQHMPLPANSTGYVPILVSQPGVMIFSSSGGQVVTIELLNVPLPTNIWFP